MAETSKGRGIAGGALRAVAIAAVLLFAWQAFVVIAAPPPFMLPGPARVWLAGTLLAALAIGLAQQVRGAHYFSHTLWAAWISWMIALLGDRLLRGRRSVTG